MSRSVKKTCICKDNNKGGKKSSRHIAKQNANKKFRTINKRVFLSAELHNFEEDSFVPSGKKYRIAYTNPWDIYDYIFSETFKDAVLSHQESYNNIKNRFGEEVAIGHSKDWREIYRDWHKRYKGK